MPANTETRFAAKVAAAHGVHRATIRDVVQGRRWVGVA